MLHQSNYYSGNEARMESFMRIRRRIQLAATLLTTMFCAVAGNAHAYTPPAPPTIEATAFILQDYQTGNILASVNGDLRIEPASLTKMMTSYVIEHELQSGRIRLTDMVTVSEKAWRMEGSRMFVEVGRQIQLGDLLKGLIIQSGNDSTVALAEHSAGSEDSFASMMNTHAQRLGMKNTHWINSTGLPDPNHYTTVHDLAILSAALIRDFPDQYKLYSQKEFVFNGIKQHNRNTLLWQDASVDGIKTGHTETAGYCLAASAVRDNMRLISVVVGTKTDAARAIESEKLLTYGFRFFQTVRLYKAGDKLTSVHVWKGERDQMALGLGQDLVVTIPRGTYNELKATMAIEPQLTAPITKGKAYGSVNLTLQGQPFTRVPLVSFDEIPEAGFVGRATDTIKMWFE